MPRSNSHSAPALAEDPLHDADSGLASPSARLAALEAELSRRLAQLAAEYASASGSETAEDPATVARLQAEVETVRLAATMELERAHGSLAAQERELQELRAQCLRHQAVLDAEQTRQAELADLERTHEEQLQALEQQLQIARQAVKELQFGPSTGGSADDAAVRPHDAAAPRELDAAATRELEALRLRCAELESQRQESAEELATCESKFELALEDVQRLKRENAELRDALAQRPEPSAEDSPETASLRRERDALAERVAELENRAENIVDLDAEQQLQDLQRRFELAVEEIQQLRNENSQLKAQPPLGARIGPPTAGPLDWEAQKQRLLAMLEAEEGGEAAETPERRQERLSIEGTLSITDQVVAEKEAEVRRLRTEVEELREKLANGASGSRQAEFDEALNVDEIVQRERERLAQATGEWEEKLRAAELEFSIERARLARERAALETAREELALQRPAAPAPGSAPEAKPRRKWLSALGLRDDDE